MCCNCDSCTDSSYDYLEFDEERADLESLEDNMPQKIEIEDVKRLNVNKGDVVVFTLDKELLTKEVGDRLLELCHGAKSVITLSKGSEVSILSQEELDELTYSKE